MSEYIVIGEQMYGSVFSVYIQEHDDADDEYHLRTMPTEMLDEIGSYSIGDTIHLALLWERDEEFYKTIISSLDDVNFGEMVEDLVGETVFKERHAKVWILENRFALGKWQVEGALRWSRPELVEVRRQMEDRVERARKTVMRTKSGSPTVFGK